jgi:hypothetical protein
MESAGAGSLEPFIKRLYSKSMIEMVSYLDVEYPDDLFAAKKIKNL